MLHVGERLFLIVPLEQGLCLHTSPVRMWEVTEGAGVVCRVSLSAMVLQLPGEFHGGCPRWCHAGLPPQRAAHHHPPTQVHGADTRDVPPGEAPQAGHHAAHGGGRRAGQPPHRSGTLWGSVPWVRGGRVARRETFSLCLCSRCTEMVLWENLSREGSL